ncbi:MAG: site-2 protease family protein [Planctomycetales bacterium]|nr:site-2 protease family protein [Planctomycetales bacterium]
MRGSWRLGTLSGIGVYVHWSFLILPLLIGGTTILSAGPWAAAEAVIFVLAVFGCVVLHEMGHALTARQFGIGTRDITLLPIGGVARLDRMPRKPWQEFAVAVAGPAVNVVIAAVLFLGLIGYGVERMLNPADFLVRLMWTNIALVAFNMLPAFPMDGGRVLRSLLAMVVSYERATNIAAIVGQTLAVVLALAGWFVFHNIMLVLLAGFVFLAARGEAKMVNSFPQLQGVRVGELMQRTFVSLNADETLEQAASRTLFTAQHDFPVIHHGALVGMMTKPTMLQAMSAGQGGRYVGELMRRDVPTVDQNEPLRETFDRMRVGQFSSVPIAADGLLVGLLTIEQVARWIETFAATPNRAFGFGG